MKPFNDITSDLRTRLELIYDEAMWLARQPK